MKILIVDDQRTQCIGLSQMLRQLGYTDLLIALSAEDAYRQLDIHSLGSGPIPCSVDMILMDVNMPGINGIEACAVIKSNPLWRDIPIIMVTTSADIQDLSAAFHAGAMDYIQKPPIQDELNVRVRSALRLKYETDERKKREYDLGIERERSEKLLLNILPAPVATRLKSGENVIADQFEAVTVLFVDIANFTPFAASMPADKLVDMLNDIFSLFDSIVEKHGLEKIKTMGDAYMAVGGLPIPSANHAEAVADAALEIREEFYKLTNNHLQLRIGVHTGPVVAGVIGKNKFIYDLWGDTVNIASRMQSQGQADSIQVSAETHEYLKHQFDLKPRGKIQVKGKGMMKVFLLQGQKSFDRVAFI